MITQQPTAGNLRQVFDLTTLERVHQKTREVKRRKAVAPTKHFDPPYRVLDASGHVERFSDFMCKDTKDESKYYRADKLLEEVRFSAGTVLLRILGVCEGQCDVHTRVLQSVLWDGSPPRSSISRFLLRMFGIHRG